MKTFSDYILEKQNFIFGGKSGLSGKEYLKRRIGGKTFSDLKENKDKVYFYYFDINKDAYIDNNDLTLTTILVLGKNGIARLYNYNAAWSIDMPLEVFEESSLFAWCEGDSMTVITTYSVTDEADINELYEEGKEVIEFEKNTKK